MTRNEFADLIFEKIVAERPHITEQYEKSKNKIGYFWIDGLLPHEIALQLANSFPSPNQMVLKKSIRENKYIGVQMNLYNPILEEVIYAFQEEKIVNLIAEICNIKHPVPTALYTPEDYR